MQQARQQLLALRAAALLQAGGAPFVAAAGSLLQVLQQQLHTAVQPPPQLQQQPALAGEYDRRTRRGKRFAGTNGVSRPKQRKQQPQQGLVFPLPQPRWPTPPMFPPYSSLLEQQRQRPLLQCQQLQHPWQQRLPQASAIVAAAMVQSK